MRQRGTQRLQIELAADDPGVVALLGEEEEVVGVPIAPTAHS